MFNIALLGRDIGYTQSPRIHDAIAQAVGVQVHTDVIDVSYDMLESAVRNAVTEYDGLYVTKPYKYDIKRYIGCDAVGAINLVRCKDRAAFNTDGVGFLRALDRNFDGRSGKVRSALILGAGGAAYSVASALISRDIKPYVLNRTLMHAVKLCAATGAELYVNQPVELAVNCTSVGADGDDVLKNLCVLPDFEYAFDLIYSDVPTPFMRRCAASGAVVQDGADMLIYQAIEGDRILFGIEADVESVYDSVKNKVMQRS